MTEKFPVVTAIISLVFALFAGNHVAAQVASGAPELAEDGRPVAGPTSPSYVPGQIIIRFKDDADVGAVAEQLMARGQKFKTITGRDHLDNLNRKYKVRNMKKLLRAAGSGLPALAAGKITKNRALLERLALRNKYDNKVDAMLALAPGAALKPARKPGLPYFEHVYVVNYEAKAADIAVICAEYAQDPDVAYAEPNYIHDAEFVPNDPSYPAQWSHQVTQAESGWDITLGTPGTVIAIIDSGVDYDHWDLAANMMGDCTGGCPAGTGYDFVDTTSTLCADVDCTGPDNDPSDNHGHGTHVAGIAAGVGDNATGIIGVCPGCRIMPLRAGYRKTDGNASLESDDILNALIYAADNGADVVNMSFGSSGLSTFIQNGVDYANAGGVLLVASAGNSGSNGYRYPAALPDVIAVGATNESDQQASFSNYGSWVDVMAPGETIYSTDISSYSYKSGTSMSAPYVGGLAGLILSHNPTWSNEDVRAAIRRASDPVILDGFGFTYGRVNVAGALQVQDPVQVRIEAPAGEQVFENASSISVYGTVQGPVSSYVVEYGQGYDPATYVALQAGSAPVNNALLATINSPGYGVFTVRIRAYNALNDEFQDRKIFINKGAAPPVQAGWPRFAGVGGYVTSSPTVVDFDNDQLMEIVVHTLPCEVYVFDHSGTIVSGWPRASNGNFNCQSTPAVGDVDNNGDLEIFVKSTYSGSGLNRVTGFHHDGTVISGWPQDAGNIFGYSTDSVSLGNIDNDPSLEILYAANYDVHVKNHNASNLPNWPQSAGYSTTPHYADLDNDADPEIVSSRYGGYVYAHHDDGTLIFNVRPNSQGRNVYDLALGDLNGDSLVEVVVGYYVHLGTDPNTGALLYGGEVAVLDHLGNMLPGWPKQYDDAVSRFSLGNLDGDSDPEIVVVNGSRVYVYNHDGTPVPGWPQATEADMYSQAAIGDLNDDGENEVVVNAANKLYAWERNGVMLYASGFPLVAGSYTNAKTPAIGDIDNDGDVDIVAVGNTTSSATTITVIDLPNAFNSANVAWPMDQHDSLNTGYLPPPVSAPANIPPVADAGANQTVNEDQQVNLSAGGSTDVDGNIVSYDWLQSAGPMATLFGADTATPDFGAPRVTGDTPLVFELTVTDDDGASDSATTTVTVKMVDTDADGMSDLWEVDYFGGLAQGPDDDSDRDGDSNLAEFYAQSNPMTGDVNGDGLLDVADMLLMERHVLGQISLDAGQIARGDSYPAAGDGEITLSDLLILRQRLLASP